MEDQLISVETAVLANEKKFNYNMGWNEHYYDPLSDNQLIHGSEKCYPNELNHDDYGAQTAAQIEYDKHEKQLIAAPTQSLLQRCLREEYKLHIVIIPTLLYFTFKIIDIQDDPENKIERPPYKDVHSTDYQTYEEAIDVI